MRSDVRIVLAGDSGVGKSSLLTSLIAETYVADVQKRIPEITLPPHVCPEGVCTKIVDTCGELRRGRSGRVGWWLAEWGAGALLPRLRAMAQSGAWHGAA